MKVIFTIIILLLLNSCKIETKEQKYKRLEKETCELAWRYASECSYELTKTRVAPFEGCTKRFAEKVLSYSCDQLFN